MRYYHKMEPYKHKILRLNMKKIFVTLLLISSLSIVSCQRSKTYKDKLQVHHEHLEPQNIDVKNYSSALFSIDTAHFAEGLKNIQKDYPVFLDGDLDNVMAVNFLKAFVTDTFCVRLSAMVEERFHDTKNLAKDIKSVYQRFNYYYPDISIPYDTYLYVSGIDYEMPSVMIQPEGTLISLDFYLGNEDRIYDFVGMPRFRSIRCQPYYITRDLAQSLYQHVYGRHYQKDVLTEMINAGKQLYFIEAMNPALPDSILLGYTSRQTEWAERYEGDVWSTLVGNDMLYANGAELFRSFFGDAPFTQAFSNEAPARLGEYIGLKIIRSYMTNNDVSLREMLENKDVQQIFQMSQYKPR